MRKSIFLELYVRNVQLEIKIFSFNASGIYSKLNQIF